MSKFEIYVGWLRLKQLFLYGDLSMAKLTLSMASILWGILLFWPGDTFGPSRHTYSLMAEWMSEHTWATLFILHGFISSWAVIWCRKDAWLVIGDCVLGGLLWTCSCSLMMCAYLPNDPPPAAISAEIVLAILSWWFLIRNEYGARR